MMFCGLGALRSVHAFAQSLPHIHCPVVTMCLDVFGIFMRQGVMAQQ